jgi:hypothetical protein
VVTDNEVAPRVVAHHGARPTDKGSETVDKQESTAQPAHRPTDDHDDTVEAHYSSLERLRPCACMGGWVYVGYTDDYGEEREACYACRRCADSLR